MIRRLLVALTAFFVSAGLCLAQDAGKQQTPQPEQKKSDKKEKKDKKKNKDKTQEDALDTSVFSDRVANDVLAQLRDGLEGHSQRLMLSAFDGDRMDGYLSFEDQIQAFFDKYDAFRVNYRIAQSAVEGPRGIVLVDFELEQIARAGNAPPQRKSAQLRFELERGKKGWRIVDFRPRAFFS